MIWETLYWGFLGIPNPRYPSRRFWIPKNLDPGQPLRTLEYQIHYFNSNHVRRIFCYYKKGDLLRLSKKSHNCANILRSVDPTFEPCIKNVTNKECENFILLLSLFRKESPDQDLKQRKENRCPLKKAIRNFINMRLKSKLFSLL